MIRSSLNVYQLTQLRDEDPIGPNSDWNAGFADALREAHAKCNMCGGTGKVASFGFGSVVVFEAGCKPCNGTGHADQTTHEEWVAHLFFCVVNKLNLHKSDLIAEAALLKDQLGIAPHQ